MEYRNLGKSGLKVSLAGLGCNNFGMRIDEEQSLAVVHRALDEGITFFDTADIYGGHGRSEEWLGKALGARRREVIIGTKFGMAMGDGPYLRGTSRRYAIACCEDSLRRLGTDYIDLYQVHMPDPSTPENETLEALDSLVRAGKVRYIGHSNYASWQLADAAAIARENRLAPYISAQNQYNLLDRAIERELIPACRHFGVGILPYFPLASGFLTGKYHRGAEIPKDTRFGAMKRLADQTLNDANFATLERLEKFAHAREHGMLDLAVSWLAAHAEVSSVICGATSPEQVTANAAALNWKMTPEELKEIDTLAPLA
ncbi:MAG: aldo/keto reductase [Candidatus Binatus sp.]|uniref:aldo/keto reductase n=1 Tax=Candidatus Binatus sp. TaxID=2811406 RepID=UPI0027266B48|nr:aldo/keto reductase [Candidatus Binatus sp.]MDO8431730.1 aldo/keto reductase [Candidatus Binatus sp.]